MDSNLRRPKSIYYDPDIHEVSGLDSSHPEQATQASVQPEAEQVHPAFLVAPKTTNKMLAKEKRLKLSMAMLKARIR